MSQARKPVQVLIGYFLILSLGLASIQAEPASAQMENGLIRQYDPETGKLNFISSANGRPLAASQALGHIPDAADPALAIAQHFGHEFGLKDAAQELTVLRSHQAGSGRLTVRYQQNYRGIPVMGGELIVNTNDQGDFYSMNGEVASDLSLPTHPSIDSEEASQIALQAAAKWYRKTSWDFTASDPTLWVFDENLLKGSQRSVELVWRMEVTPIDSSLPVRELVLVNAQRGSISLHFNQIDTGAKDAGLAGSGVEGQAISEGLGYGGDASPLAVSPSGGYRRTYTANHGTSLPGQLLCDQTQASCTNGSIPDADKAHQYAAETWTFYHDHHGRDSIDNQGMVIISTVQYSTDYLNAFWDGTQMVYGDSMVADDIVGHELTHGITQYESNLFYYYQSGAINESFSDVWGELIDQSNTTGNDTAAVKWQIGEDSPVGAFRSMSDPTLFGDPDSITSPNYDTDPLFQDNGGVHHNSGINNKAAYLMVDGGTFGGKTVTALGKNKTLAVYYEAQTNLLTSGADYADLYSALYQACLNLVGGAQGITNADCQEVRDATDAVRMNAQPASDPNFNTDAPLCDSGQAANTLFFDDMESGTAKWTFGSTVGGTRWGIDSPDGAFAHSGLHSLYANDRPAIVANTFARLSSAILIPSEAYLHFNQAFGFEDYFFLGTFDGGVLEYSTNGGTSWTDAGPLFIDNGYNGVIDPNYDNPLRGRAAFVADSHGYISSRVNLSSLVNQNVLFRWRMGLDTGGNDFGWWLDDVRIYTCSGSSNTATNTPTATATSTATNTPTPTTTTTLIPKNPPVVLSINRADPNPAYATSVDFAVTFSEPVSGVDTSDFGMATTGVTKSFVSSVMDTGDQTSYTVTVNTGFGNGTIRLDVVDDDSIKNAASNPLGGVGTTNGDFTTGETYDVSEGVIIKVGGESMGTYPVYQNPSLVVNFLSLVDGPVRVTSSRGGTFFPSERAISGGSFNEVMGYAGNQLTTEYWFPWYDQIYMQTWILVGNPSSSQTAYVDIYIGGVKKNTSPYAILPGDRITPKFDGVVAGPVRVVSMTGAGTATPLPVFASERSLFGSSFNEVMGYPSNQFTTEYWFPWYDGIYMNSWVLVGNPSSTKTAYVDIYIGGVKQGDTRSIAPNGNITPQFPGVLDGPVRVVSVSGTGTPSPINIFASERSLYGPSFNEVMGVPLDQFTTEYWFTWYDNQSMKTWVLVGNPSSSQTAYVDIYIGGVKQGATRSIPPNGKITPTFTLSSGPVRVVSVTGAGTSTPINIFTSERTLYGPSFNEMMGYPADQLTTEYWFTWYDSIYMNTDIYVSKP